MSKETTVQQPLYKRLIERQKGENGMIPSIMATQEFTILAVDNLEYLADALDWIQHHAMQDGCTKESLKAVALEALKKVS